MAKPLAVTWFNGAFMPLSDVKISPLDRAFLYGDAIYEVIPVFSGRCFLLEPHLNRLDRSLGEIHIRNPYTRAEWRTLVTELVRRNAGDNVSVYLQVSRGADEGRDHGFPGAHVAPTVFAMVTPIPQPHPDRHGIRAITCGDERWSRCDIKSTSLLANVLARQKAREANAGEAILLRDGYLTEGSASSVIIVEHGVLIRRPTGREILPGTTTDSIIDLARACGLDCRAEPISEARLRSADEIWVAAATRGVAPVVILDDKPVGNGAPGPVWQKIAAALEVAKSAGVPV